MKSFYYFPQSLIDIVATIILAIILIIGLFNIIKPKNEPEQFKQVKIEHTESKYLTYLLSQFIPPENEFLVNDNTNGIDPMFVYGDIEEGKWNNGFHVICSSYTKHGYNAMNTIHFPLINNTLWSSANVPSKYSETNYQLLTTNAFVYDSDILGAKYIRKVDTWITNDGSVGWASTHNRIESYTDIVCSRDDRFLSNTMINYYRDMFKEIISHFKIPPEKVDTLIENLIERKLK